MRRRDVVREHNEEAARLNQAAGRATGPERKELKILAKDHQEYADMARHGEYPYDLED